MQNKHFSLQASLLIIREKDAIPDQIQETKLRPEDITHGLTADCDEGEDDDETLVLMLKKGNVPSSKLQKLQQ